MSDKTATIAYIPTSHLDLFWLGSYKSCLARGVDVIRQYVDRCLESPEETFLIETAVFAEEFLRRYPEYHDLSALYTTDGGQALTARVWETTGRESRTSLSGWLIEHKERTPVDFLDRPLRPPVPATEAFALGTVGDRELLRRA